ncbi:MAG: hypothetical protein IT306_14615 [Chloroflexi bacterium]|nr:hypothetical protein [Chloroflexota bacterium]
MTQTIINDAASLARQRVLLAHFERAFAEWSQTAEYFRQNGDSERRCAALGEARIAEQAAQRVSMRIRAAEQAAGPVTMAPAPALTPQSVALAEACQATDKPPEQIVGLADWLRRRLGPVFVWVTAARWQEIAYLMLTARPGGPR